MNIIERESEATVDNQGRVSRQHTEKTYFESDSPASTAEILDRLGLQPGDPHEYDPLVGLKSVKVVQLKHRNPYRYEIVKTFSNTIPDQQDMETDNPFDDEPEVSWEDGEAEITIDKDRDGKAILLPTGRPFDPGVKILIPAGRLVITRNERVLDVDPGLNYRKRVNANPWAGRAAETMMLKSITSNRKTRNRIVYFPTTYTFEWNPLGWNEELLAADTYEIVDDEVRPIRDGDGNPITDPLPISESGQLIPRESLPDSAHFIQAKKYKTANFEDMRLPI
jgi:hypothetical protein